MPTYEYRCGACGTRFERFQKITAEPVAVCPECGEEEVERLISRGGGLVFKGSGFYATDYRDPPRTPSKEGEAGADGGGSADDGGSAADATKGEEGGGADD